MPMLSSSASRLGGVSRAANRPRRPAPGARRCRILVPAHLVLDCREKPGAQRSFGAPPERWRWVDERYPQFRPPYKLGQGNRRRHLAVHKKKTGVNAIAPKPSAPDVNSSPSDVFCHQSLFSPFGSTPVNRLGRDSPPPAVLSLSRSYLGNSIEFDHKGRRGADLRRVEEQGGRFSFPTVGPD